MAKTRKMLNDWDAPYLQALVKLIETQSKQTLTEWAVNYCKQEILPIWQKYYPEDFRLKKAIDEAHEWLAGKVKLPPVKAAILDCHCAARDSVTNPAAQAAARAIGQSASTVHSATHCIGIALYGALAVAYESAGTNAEWAIIEKTAAEECKRMLMTLQQMSIPDEPNPAKINWKC